jgi:hypothetical protein
MKKRFLFLAGVILLGQAFTLDGQKLIPNSYVTGISYASGKVNRIYIPPPKDFYMKSEIKGGAEITVFYTGFTAEAKIAVEHAVSILEYILPADAHFTILATWTNLSSSSVLANSSTTGVAGGWAIDALNPFAYYPVALAEKIAGESLNADSDGDIVLNINSTMPWYLGVDGNTVPLKYDLVTVILHEIIHGLGFFDSMTTDRIKGSYGFSGIPIIYDTFIENFAGENLTDTLVFENPSTGLKTAITGNNLWFSGPLVSNKPGGRAQLYAPSQYSAGSSIAHLDDGVPDVDGLMRPFIDMEAAIHDPGELILSMLADLGWVNTRIKHSPRKDTEENLTEVQISAEIFSDTLFNRDKIAMVWSSDNFESHDTIFLTAPGTENIFSVNFPIPQYNTEVEYYLSVEDTFSRIYRSPSFIDRFHYSFYIGQDTVKPEISHTLIGSFLETVVDTISINAVVTDNIGVDTVFVEYKINNGITEFLGLSGDSLDNYSCFFTANELSLTGGDSVLYRIIAVDNAGIPNSESFPRTGYQKIQIVKLNPVADSYITDFSDASDDFFNTGFGITQPAGFTSPALHTKHPYESPEENGDSINYIALLKTPVTLDTAGMIISFMEVVLVEPGETGSQFGTEEFYDYVIVEGSRNFGKTWFRFADGYDSRYVSTWAASYNNSIVGSNSTYVGTESIMKQHTFNINESASISAGDTLLIRFRLFSDPYANGWGWVIEDLSIGAPVSAINDEEIKPFILFPNPGNGLINIRNISDSGGKIIRYNVFNSTGTSVASGFTSGTNDDLIDISFMRSGMYFVTLYYPGRISTFKYILLFEK